MDVGGGFTPSVEENHAPWLMQMEEDLPPIGKVFAYQ